MLMPHKRQGAEGNYPRRLLFYKKKQAAVGDRRLRLLLHAMASAQS